MSGMNVVDSSGWLEYLTGTDRARLYSPAIKDKENLVVPVICIYEVVKRILRDGNETDAKLAVHAMTEGRLVDLDLSLSLEAVRYKLPLADSIIYATAQRFSATLWTQDDHFEKLPMVKYFVK